MSKEKKIQKSEPTAEHVTTQGIQIKVAEKVCGKCKRLLPAKDFWGSRASKDGLQGACKDCQLETPLGTHTTNTNKTPKTEEEHPRLTTCEEEPSKLQKIKDVVEKIPEVVVNATKKVSTKKTRPSRAHPIGSGQRKECAKCKFRITAKSVSVGDGGKCMNKMAIADKENKAKVCPYRE